VTVPADKRSAFVFDLHGQARAVDLRRFPKSLNVPPANTNVNADYHVSGSMPVGSSSSQTPHEQKVASEKSGVASGFPPLLVATARPGHSAERADADSRAVNAELRFGSSTVAGAKIAAGSTAGAT